ncbi:MAG: hypothetical protein FWD47_09800 [Treponema sp.]|nr:hypothetical protein [Treponema sp.]
MNSENDCFFQLSPLKKYKTPKYPVYALARDNPDLLKNLPSRWKKNAKVISCLGAMGMLTLSGCFPLHKCSRCGFSHLGGSGGPPVYIVYLTEQEALSIIRTKIEIAGLNLDSIPPDNKVNTWGNDIGFNLYNEENDVGLAFVNLFRNGWQRCNTGYNEYVAEEIRDEFAKQKSGTTIGVFHNPDIPFGLKEPNAAQIAEAENILREQLEAQVQIFINLLQVQRIIQ